MDKDWYLYYHMSNLGHQNIRRRPPNTYKMPNSRSPYPPKYTEFNVVNSSTTPPNPAAIYSGVEPLSSLDAYGLAQHFDHTSVPETATLLSDRTGMYTRRLTNKYDKLIHSMNKPVEYFNQRYHKAVPNSR
jgi:hypothetical protein